MPPGINEPPHMTCKPVYVPIEVLWIYPWKPCRRPMESGPGVQKLASILFSPLPLNVEIHLLQMLVYALFFGSFSAIPLKGPFVSFLPLPMAMQLC